MMVIIFLFTFVSIGILWYLGERRKYKDIEKIAGPPVKWISGNAEEFGTDIVDLFQNSQRLVRTYGSLVRVWLGPFRLNLFMTDPNHVEYFLSSQTHIKKSASYDLFIPWLGQGLINSTGETWKKHRRILTPAFHFKILEQFSDSFHNELKVLVQKLKEHDGKTVNIYPYITLYAMDALCETSMAINASCQKKCEDKYHNALRVFLEIFIRRFFSVLKQFEFFLRFTKDMEPLYKNVNIMHNITRQVIRKRKEERQHINSETFEDEHGIRKKKVFLDILLDNKELTDEEIREEVDTFLFAGHDTVSSAMSFIIYEIAKYPDVQEKILEEIRDMVGTDRSEEITLAKLKELAYLDRVVKEVMRLYPPVPLYERQLTEEVMLDGLRIPAGTTVSFHPYSQHRNPKLFPDPERFDPDRFLPENIKGRHPYAYIPFSAGPRNCIGQKYAMMNVKTTIANVIRNFELYPSDIPHTPLIGNDSVMKSVNGLPIKLVYRK